MEAGDDDETRNHRQVVIHVFPGRRFLRVDLRG